MSLYGAAARCSRSSLAACAYWYLFVWATPAAAAVAWTPLTARWRSTPPCLPSFALHHSLFARESIKHRIARMVPDRLVRSFYVWTASLLLLVVLACWQPLAGEVYRVTGWRAVAHAAVQLGRPLADCPIGRDNRSARAGRHQAGIWTRRIANHRPVPMGAASALPGVAARGIRRGAHDGRSAHVCRHHHRLFVCRDSMGGAIAPPDIRRAIRRGISSTVRWRIIPYVY